MGGVAIVAMAQGSPSAMSAAASNLTAGDQQFIRGAAHGGMAEVELGQLAVQKASSDAVKQFGQRMVDDHGKANDQLKQLAASKGVKLPHELSSKDKATKEELSKLSGKDFDKAYMSDMLKDHKKDVAEFKHESATASDPQIKDFAAQTLPTLESHLHEAEKIEPSAQ
jgi:putative membrane protein